MNKIKGFKGFGKDLKCRGYQYETGKDYVQNGDIECCENGFHFCENPLDVFLFYSPNDSRYCEVEGYGIIKKSDNKCAVSNIHIGAEIGIDGLIEAGVKFILDKVERGDNSAATNTGYSSAATNTGNFSAATNTGYFSAATNTGNYSAATNTGNRSAATNTGNFSAATNTGDRSAATNTGNYSAATNTGDISVATNTGKRSAAKVIGKQSIAIATGLRGKAAGAIGSWIVLTERNNECEIIDVKAVKVDGDIVKADTYYTLENGKIIEAQE